MRIDSALSSSRAKSRSETPSMLLRQMPSKPSAAAVISLLKQQEKRQAFGDFGRDLVRDKFPWRKMSDFLIEDYRNFLADKNRKA